MKAEADNPVPVRELNEKELSHGETIRERIDSLQRTLYTFEDSLLPAYPLEIPEGFWGTEIRFSGGRYADMLTNEYFNCLGQSMLPDWGPLSVISCKTLGGYSNNYSTLTQVGMGNYDPRDYAGGKGWPRDIGRLIMERLRAGHKEMARKGIAFYDDVLYGCGSYKPEPLPHWIMCYQMDEEGRPVTDYHKDYFVKTTDGQTINGNMESDGHGLVMLAKYQYWRQSGKDSVFLENTWKATVDAAEWICWAVDHPVDPLASYPQGDCRRDMLLPKGCVWSENESVHHGGADVFNNSILYTALLAYAEMAKHKGDKDMEARWRHYANGILEGMLGDYPSNGFVIQDEVYGSVWAVGYTYWKGFESLGAVFNMAELLGLDITGMDPRLLTITRHTYEKMINDGQNGERLSYYPAWWAYGQSFLTETAMLLDEMADVTRLIESTAKFIHSPFYYPWVASEGTIVHRSGKYWRRSNWLGNEVQIASAVRDMRYIAGVDDYTDQLRLVPRLPLTWDSVSVKNDAIMTVDGERTICFDYVRNDRGGYDISNFRSLNGSIPAMDIRFGPFPLSATAADIRVVNGDVELPFEFIGRDHPLHMGDSTWAWIRSGDQPLLQNFVKLSCIHAECFVKK